MRIARSFLFTLFALCFYGALAKRNYDFVFPDNDDKILEAPDIDLAKNINYLGARLAQKLTLSAKNIVYSPLSIAVALGMLIRGASGQTKTQLCSLLNQSCYDGDPISMQMKKLLEHYESLQNEDFTLQSTNLAYLSNRFYVPHDNWYFKELNKYYKANGERLDFAKQWNIRQINDNVTRLTNGKIKNVLNVKDDYTKTVMMLINVLYFKSNWQDPFDSQKNEKLPFYNLNGGKTTIDFLYQSQNLKFFENKQLKLVELPYISFLNEELSFILLLPNSNYSIHKLKKEIMEKDDQLDSVLSNLEHEVESQVELYLPKFSYKYKFDLKKEMEKLNVRDAFSNRKADFSPITDCRCINKCGRCVYVSKASHTAFIEVGEKGTEAGAVTVAEFYANRFGNEPPVVRVDRPFAYVIRDKSKGVNLFVGFVTHLRSTR